MGWSHSPHLLVCSAAVFLPKILSVETISQHILLLKMPFYNQANPVQIRTHQERSVVLVPSWEGSPVSDGLCALCLRVRAAVLWLWHFQPVALRAAVLVSIKQKFKFCLGDPWGLEAALVPYVSHRVSAHHLVAPSNLRTSWEVPGCP